MEEEKEFDEIELDGIEEPQNNIEQTQPESTYPKLDYTIKDPEQRNKIVHHIVDTIPPEKLTPYYLDKLARYLVEDQKSKKEKTILTDNRMVTINKRETSFQGLVAKLENGEDGIYNFISQGDKNILLVPKIGITEDDIKNVPGLKELRQAIAVIEAQQKVARGKKKYYLTKQLIEMRQDQYVLKGNYSAPVNMMKLTSVLNQIDLSENITIDENGQPHSDGLISFFNPDHVSCLLCNYSKLKQQTYDKFENDMYYLMLAFDDLTDEALKEKYPILYDIMVYKIDGLSNKEIREKIQKDHNTTYSIEYLSALWRKKIPKIISDYAKEKWIIYHYTEEEYGKWKRCSRCHEIKLAHSYFFSKNKTSKDGWYSLCKCCRNKK